MPHISIRTRTNLNNAGNLGATLFICCPIAMGFAYQKMADTLYMARRYPGIHSGDVSGLAMLMVILGIAFSLSIVLLLVGRDYEHEVTVEPAGKVPSTDQAGVAAGNDGRNSPAGRNLR